MVKSKSVLKREAAQRGEPAPVFGDTRVSSPGVEFVPAASASRLVEIGPDHPVWSSKDGSTVMLPGGLSPYFAKIRPPESATDQEIRAVSEAFSRHGQVMVLPRPRSSSPVPEKQAAKTPRRSARETAMAILPKVRHPNPEEVRAEVEASLSAEGL